MNLPKLVKYIILIWLPLANLESYNKKILNQLLQNDKNSKNLSEVIEKEKKTVVENIEEKTEKSEVKRNRENLQKHFGRASENFPKRNSANTNLKKYSDYTKTKMNVKNAHKLTGSIKNDISALKVVSIIKNRSDILSKTYLRKKRSKRKGLNDKLVPDFDKAEPVLEINLEERSETSVEDYEDDDFDENGDGNSTELGSYLGAPCELTCSDKLLHVFCDPTNRVCECEEKYPVQIGVGRGCEKPKQLGDQCFYAQTCSFFDPNAVCAQINHNAICQCKQGYHMVALRKGVKRMFCSEDITVVSADLPTLLGVATGIAVLTGLICFVLRLFGGNRYPAARRYGNTNIAPPLLLSSDNQWINGIPLTVHGRPSSRSSCQRSTTNLAQYSRSKGVLVPASRAGAARAAAILLIPCHLQASRHTDSEVINTSNNDDSEDQPNEVEQSSHLGSRRPSLSSVQSTTSSQKSMTYSARRFEQENLQREHRAAMRTAREGTARMVTPATPSPMSTDQLIPSPSNTEEDPLCFTSADQPSQSEPPSLSAIKGNTSTVQEKEEPENLT